MSKDTRTKEETLEDFIQDAAAYLRAVASVNQKPELTLLVLTHDIMGLAHNEPCFLPRVSGYADVERKGRNEH